MAASPICIDKSLGHPGCGLGNTMHLAIRVADGHRGRPCTNPHSRTMQPQGRGGPCARPQPEWQDGQGRGGPCARPQPEWQDGQGRGGPCARPQPEWQDAWLSQFKRRACPKMVFYKGCGRPQGPPLHMIPMRRQLCCFKRWGNVTEKGVLHISGEKRAKYEKMPFTYQKHP